MFSKNLIVILLFAILFQITYQKHKVEEVDAETKHKEHVFLIKTNLTKEEVQERLSKPKKNEVDNENEENDIDGKIVSDPSSNVKHTTSLKQKDKDKAKEGKKNRKRKLNEKKNEKKEEKKEKKEEKKEKK